MSEKRLAILAGNGVSISYCPELGLDRLTRDALDNMMKYSDEHRRIAETMLKLSLRLFPGADNINDFEKLVGAFSYEEHTLDHIKELTEASPQNAAAQTAVNEVRKFSERQREIVMSYILDLIRERSVFKRDKGGWLTDFIRDCVERFDEDVRIGNLNYDVLLEAAILQAGGADNSPGGFKYTGPSRKPEIDIDGALKEQEPPSICDSFPDDGVQLYDLHGSLRFWENGEGEQFAISTKRLKSEGWFGKLRESDSRVRPLVVLTNAIDKPAEVGRPPYDAAYSAFVNSLKRATHWLIVGYSFRDFPVNKALREAYYLCDRRSELRIFVSDCQDGLKEFREPIVRDKIRSILDCDKEYCDDPEKVFVDLKGFKTLLEKDSGWRKFTE